jgi:predicted ATPase/DNA-binding CsgD family transcriptional regulator
MATGPAQRANPVRPDREAAPASRARPALTTPWLLTRFIGRQIEIAEVRNQLGECRLLTLAGPGGCGKTRLALEVASRNAKQMRDGVFQVELAGLTDSNLVPQHIAATLGVQDQPGHPLPRSLVTHLRSRELLLVLDNCEHLLDPVAQLSDLILRNCSHVRILVTSREPLNLAGEVVWRVPGMSLPRVAEPISIEALRASDAVALFVDRAKLSVPNFVLDEQSGPNVAQICMRLDGIPLAVELAAAQLRFLTVEQILERLEQRFQLLIGGSRAALPRHRTLRATVDWSYGLLSEHERMVFHRLSVFAGSFGLDAAESVASMPGEPATLDILSRLVDKSMVLAERGAPRAVRYRLLETLREYGKEKLEQSREANKIRRRHAVQYLNLAEAAETKLTGPQQSEWLSRLDLDYDNLRAAIGWSRQAEPEIASRIAAALTRFWLMRGLWTEGRGRLVECLSRPEGDDLLRAKVMLGAGTLAEAHGDYPEAKRLLEQSAADYGRHGDVTGRARALVQLGRVTYYQGDLELARSLLEDGLASARRMNDRWAVALGLTELGHVAWRRGLYAEARGLAQQGLERFRELDDRWNVAYAVDYLGHVAHSLKRYAAARRNFEESLSITTDLNDLWGVAHSHANLGDVALDERRLDAAESHLVEALDRMQELGRPSALAAILEGFAGLAAAQAQPLRAITLEGAAEGLRQAYGFAWRLDLRTRVEGWLPAARSAAGQAAAAKAERNGHAMNLESAIAYAIDGARSGSTKRPSRDTQDMKRALTRRELDIVTLVAKGLTSREIASRLFISQRTAETHIDRILTKLNFRSRAQIAVWAVQTGLLPSGLRSGQLDHL